MQVGNNWLSRARLQLSGTLGRIFLEHPKDLAKVQHLLTSPATLLAWWAVEVGRIAEGPGSGGRRHCWGGLFPWKVKLSSWTVPLSHACHPAGLVDGSGKAHGVAAESTVWLRGGETTQLSDAFFSPSSACYCSRPSKHLGASIGEEQPQGCHLTKAQKYSIWIVNTSSYGNRAEDLASESEWKGLKVELLISLQTTLIEVLLCICKLIIVF